MVHYPVPNNVPETTELFPNIVQLQAVYGFDTTPDDGNYDVTAWSATTPATAADWQQVRAIRVALVARGREREPGATLDGALTASSCNLPIPHPAAVCWKPDPRGNGVKIDVSADNPNWQDYRYRVMETTVPIRNNIWSPRD